MWLSRYFVMFALYSVLGWVYESTFCTIKEGKWENRGFLYGPIVPIYGVGATGITMVYDALQNYAGYSLNWWQVFLIGYLGSIVLEFGTSWVLEKLFHAVWWDYSNMPFNLQGRVCLPCSLGFGAAGLLVIYGLYPLMNRIVTPEVSMMRFFGTTSLGWRGFSAFGWASVWGFATPDWTGVDCAVGCACCFCASGAAPAALSFTAGALGTA